MGKGFSKGDPNINRAGRKKGQSNRSIELLRGAIHNFVDDNIDTIQADYDKLEPLQRLGFIEKLLSHILPKPIVSLEQLSEDELDILLKRLRSEQKPPIDVFAQIRLNAGITNNEDDEKRQD
jgi:hypothetical protein